MTSLAEYCGLWPTAGGQQFYIQKLASDKWRPILSYLVGWTLLIAEITTAASCSLNAVDVTATFVTLLYPDFTWQVRNLALCLHLPSSQYPALTTNLAMDDLLALYSHDYHSIGHEPLHQASSRL